MLHLWIPAPLLHQPVPAALHDGGMHLAVLTALRLQRSWGAQLRVYGLIDDETDREHARDWLRDLADRARFPKGIALEVMQGSLEEALTRAPQSDLDLLGLPAAADPAFVRLTVILSRSACLFLGDSGQESALA